MIIDALLQYARDRNLVSRPGYKTKNARWLLDFAGDGRFLAIIPLSENGSMRSFDSVPDLIQGEMVALRTIRKGASQFLLTPIGDLLGFAKPNEDASKRKEDHRVCLELMMECECEPIKNVAIALDSTEIIERIMANSQLLKPRPNAVQNATIRIDGRWASEMTEWQDWWQRLRASLAKTPKKKAGLYSCHATGELVTPSLTHCAVTGLLDVGANKSGAKLLSFDKAAFESYHFKNGQNAAMTEQIAKVYVDAIDHLLRKSVIYSWRRPKAKAKNAAKELSSNTVKLGGARLAYWYVGPLAARVEVETHDDLIAAFMGSAARDAPPPEDPDDERLFAEDRLRRMIERIRTGKDALPIRNVRFCIMALSGAGGRVMLRDFIEGTVLQLAEQAEHWFSDLALTNYWGHPGAPPSLEQILTAPLPSKKHDQDYLKWITPAGAWRQALWRSALMGGRLPGTAFARSLLEHNKTVVKGDLTDKKTGPEAQRTSRLRLALVKAYLIRKGIKMEPALDPEHPSAAYHCGRLLATYDSLQREALGDVGAGVIQRYYGGALTNPSGVFGQLSRMAQTHLSKKGGGIAAIYAKRIAEIHNGIRREGDHPASYPSALSQDDQALFALGFWHQIAAINKEIAENAAAKKARQDVSNKDQTTEKGA